MKYITLKMVAEKAEVSVNTASRAINNKSDINEETKKKVLKIAQELGYVQNATAVALRTKKTRTLGVVIADNRKYDQSSAYRGDNHSSKDTNDYYIKKVSMEYK